MLQRLRLNDVEEFHVAAERLAPEETHSCIHVFTQGFWLEASDQQLTLLLLTVFAVKTLA